MKYVITVLAGAIFGLAIVIVQIEIRVENLERQLSRIEDDYQYMAAENAQLRRVLDQDLVLLTVGWPEEE